MLSAGFELAISAMNGFRPIHRIARAPGSASWFFYKVILLVIYWLNAMCEYLELIKYLKVDLKNLHTFFGIQPNVTGWQRINNMKKGGNRSLGWHKSYKIAFLLLYLPFNVECWYVFGVRKEKAIYASSWRIFWSHLIIFLERMAKENTLNLNRESWNFRSNLEFTSTSQFCQSHSRLWIPSR